MVRALPLQPMTRYFLDDTYIGLSLLGRVSRSCFRPLCIGYVASQLVKRVTIVLERSGNGKLEN